MTVSSITTPSVPIMVTDLSLVSLVDGADLPMRISNNVNCPVADCPS